MSALSLRRDPVRLVLSRGLWASAWYLLAYQVTGWVLLSIALAAALTGAALGLTVVGLPLLLTAAGVIRWCANAERARLRPLLGDVPAGYRDGEPGGVLARVRARWSDPSTWRDLAYLIGLFFPLATLGLIAATIWLVLLAGITMPAWYWAPWQSVDGVRYHGYSLGYFPNGPHGHPGYGFYIDTLPEALLVAAACLAGFLLFSYVLVATARAHAAVARGLLQAPRDPLGAAREVLRRPGPLAAAGRPRLDPEI